MEAGGHPADMVPALLTESAFSQTYREYLEKAGILDGRYRAQKLDDGMVALPVLEEKLDVSMLENIAPGSSCRKTLITNPVLSKKGRVRSPAQKLRIDLCNLLESYGAAWTDNLDGDLPHSWQRHGDLVILREDCFCDSIWKKIGDELWSTVACSLGSKRLAKQGRVLNDGVRSPNVTLLLGDNGWVEHVDNGIRYTFDVTKCMFSAGNIVEKQRVATLRCSEEVVVDLYAGIGYFTLPFLVHAGAAFVHACEWNPHAVTALRRNLELNKVSHKCRIHEGDNRQLPLHDVADRVNLGLIPSSEAGYYVACRVLKKNTGAFLYGDPRQVIYPRNSTGMYCGVGENKCFPSANLSFPSDFKINNMSENQTKEEIGKAAKQILDSFNFENLGKKVFEDFAKSWPYILIALAIAMVVSLLFLILLRFVAGILVWLLIIGVIGIIAYGIYHCYKEYDTFNKQGATITDVGFTTNLSVYGNVTWLAASLFPFFTSTW